MKKYLLFTVFLFISILSFGQEIKYVRTEQLNIRSGAGGSYEVLGKAMQGDRVTVISKQGKWSEIELGNGIKGFASSRFLSGSSDSESPTKESSWTTLLFLSVLALFGIYKFLGGKSSSFGSSTKSRETNTIKPQLKPALKPKYICKHCGVENEDLKSLLGWTYLKSPSKKHQALEGGIQQIYSCKHCGVKNKSLKSLVSWSCIESPTKKHQPLV